MLTRAADTGHSNQHNAQGSASFWMCKVRCWRWLFGNIIPISRYTGQYQPDHSPSTYHILSQTWLGIGDVLSCGRKIPRFVPEILLIGTGGTSGPSLN